MSKNRKARPPRGRPGKCSRETGNRSLNKAFLVAGAQCISKNRPGWWCFCQAAVAGILVISTLLGGSEGAKSCAWSLEAVLLLGDDLSPWAILPLSLLSSSRLEAASASKRGVFGFVVVPEVSDWLDREAAGEPEPDMMGGARSLDTEY